MFRYPVYGYGDQIQKGNPISVETACQILYGWDNAWRMLKCESDEDISLLRKTYPEVNKDNFNILRNIGKDTDKDYSWLAYPATMDKIYAENLFYSFSGGIRELDVRYRVKNTHQTTFNFGHSHFFRFIFVENEKDENKKKEKRSIVEDVISITEDLNHPSYEEAKAYLEYVWSVYKKFFTDGYIPSLDEILEVNKNFNLPWYKRLNR